MSVCDNGLHSCPANVCQCEKKVGFGGKGPNSYYTFYHNAKVKGQKICWDLSRSDVCIVFARRP